MWGHKKASITAAVCITKIIKACPFGMYFNPTRGGALLPSGGAVGGGNALDPVLIFPRAG